MTSDQHATNLKVVFEQFQDYLAPKLDVYEQAIYLYLFRHSRLLGQTEIVVGFRSARRRMALGSGYRDAPMSADTCYDKLRSLETKQCLTILGTETNGTRIGLRLPSEIPGTIPEHQSEIVQKLEEMDFFETPENRKLILAREGEKCFYCRRALNGPNWVIEHVISRPDGDNSYRNVVAACRSCNNRKGDTLAEAYVRSLYREGFLNEQELQETLTSLQSLKNGDLKPDLLAARGVVHEGSL